jgi:hypothetical protein
LDRIKKKRTTKQKRKIIMATRPFDLSKFRKDITKSIEGLSIGFHDPTDWVSTGNYALNFLISGDFKKGVPLGKVTVFAGESGSGKTVKTPWMKPGYTHWVWTPARINF